MKKFLVLFASVLVCGMMSAQLKVSIMGDSYSTFKGTMPNYYDTFYPTQMCGVTEQSQQWWAQVIEKNGWVLEKNDSWSGSTVCCRGYNHDDYSDRAFVTRLNRIGAPDILFIFGGTNDDWTHEPFGDYKYSDWTKEDLYFYRPAFAYLLANLKALYPNMKIYSLLNDGMSENLGESMREICKHYGVPVIAVDGIEKRMNHPTAAGMTKIAEQIQAFLDAEKK